MQGGACTNLFLMLLELLLEYASLRQFKKVTPILRLSEPAATMSAKMTHTDECPNRQDLSALNTSFSTGLPTSRCSSLPCPHHIVQHCSAHITLFSTALTTSHCSVLLCPHRIVQHCPAHITRYLGPRQFLSANNSALNKPKERRNKTVKKPGLRRDAVLV